MKKNILIIGAGIGGLATAIQLAKAGNNVTVYEKNNVPGGRCQRLVRNGHIFDTGPTMYLFPNMYEDFFNSINEDINKHLKLIRVNPTYNLFFPDKSKFTLDSDLQQMKSQLETIEPGSFSNYQKYLEAGGKHYDLAIYQLTGKHLSHPQDYFNLTNIKSLLKTNALHPHYWYTSHFFKDQRLKAAFTFQDSYLSLDPYTAPAIYSLFTYSEQTEGSYLPQGGMYQVILTLTKLAEKYGVKLNYGMSVKQINVTNRSATGITLNDDTVIPSDQIVVNADLTYAYNHLLPPSLTGKKLLHKKHSCSALIFHWGLDKQYPDFATHNLFFSKDYRDGFDQVVNHSTPPDHPHFYAQVPSLTDKTRAPHGCETLSIIVPINHLYPSHPIDWNAYKKEARTYILKTLREHGFKDLESHIKFEISYTPLDWENHLNLPFGAIYGLHHNLSQLGYLRPKRQHKYYRNIFFVGASNHPGSGLPTVLTSSRYTANAILKNNGNI